MKIQTAIFDMDGTLLNTLDDLADSVNFVLDAHGFPERSLSEVRHMVGNGIPTLIRRAVPAHATQRETDDCIEQMLTYYASHCNQKTAPYPGIADMLTALRANGVATAVVTNKAQIAAETLSREIFGDRLSVVVGAREGLRFKPSPDGVWTALRELGVGMEGVVYVGDSEVDMRTALNAQLPAVGVLWGFRDRSDLAPYAPLALVSSPKELEKLLLNASF